MKRHKIIYKAAALILGVSMLLTGCGSSSGDTGVSNSNVSSNSGEQSTTELPPADLSISETAMITEVKGITFIRDGMIRNPLTGCWIDKKYLNKRPIAVQIENTEMAIPQYGLLYADIVYEMLTEASITRFMPIFTEYDRVEKFEPIRSNRHYYDRKAVEYDAIHVFCGASDYANDNDLYWGHYPYAEFIDLIRDPGLNRDTTRYAPHNAYTIPSQIDEQIDAKGFSRYHRSYYTENHQFKEEFSYIEGQTAEVVSIPFFNNRPWYEYDDEDQVYYRFQFGGKHRDYQDGYQIWCTNILIQLVDYKPLEGYESAGSRDLDWTGSGKGYYCTGGKMIPVTWRYDNYSTRWYTENGEELKMNPGKTWIEVYDEDLSSTGITFEAKKEEAESEE